MGETATIYDVLRAKLTKHCKYRILVRRARGPAFDAKRNVNTSACCLQRGKHAVKHVALVHPIGRTKSHKSLIPMWAAPAAERVNSLCFEHIN